MDYGPKRSRTKMWAALIVSTTIIATSPLVFPFERAVSAFGKTSSPSLLPDHNEVATPDKASCLLADGRLIVVDTNTGGIVAERRLTTGLAIRVTGHFIACSSDRRRIFILLPGPAASIQVLDAGTLRILSIHSLGIGVFRSLAHGPLTGRLYVFGSWKRDVIVTVLDEKTGTALLTLRNEMPGGFDWSVYQGDVSRDERRVFVSYHGAANPDSSLKGTTGIDWFDIRPGELIRCPKAPRINAGCIPGHGGFSTFEDGLLVATGESIVLQTDKDGNVQQGFETGLHGNHLMEFAVDSQRGRLYAVGSCGYVPGFSSVDIKIGAAVAVGPELRFLDKPKQPILVSGEVCGERLALMSGDRIIIAQSRKPVPDPDRTGALVLVDRSTSKIVRTIPLPSEPVDLFVH